ncbi:polysaccharide biosynthesis tyrosine autokinase [Telmatobacter sp. DSM 110680]|uniref:non-specific protein-tyrosine kinase n=1 Tax=Telmatobacter sp. DSM 110680 TaxID=3036704 RepID=A0AAU7DCH3_9BACT
MLNNQWSDQGPANTAFEMGNGSPMDLLEDNQHLPRILQFLKKRAWIVGVSILIGILIGVVVNHFSVRLYTALATIEVDSQDASSQFRLQQAIGSDVDTSERLDTEIEILRSRSLALETIKSLHLESNPDFIKLPNGLPLDLSKPEVRDVAISVFRGATDISRRGHTDLIQVRATSGNPQLASLIANALIDRYIERSFRENYTATAKISSWLDQKLNGLRANLERSQARILQLQKDIGVYGIDPSHSIVVANLEELNKQYADAQVNRLLKESELQQIGSSSPDVIDAALGSTDPALSAAKQKLQQLNDEITSLTQTYGPSYPRVKTLKAQMAELRREIEHEERAQIARSQKEFEAAQNNESKLQEALNKQEEDAYGKGAKSAEYELARQDYETNRLLYDGLQQKLQEATILSGLRSTSIHTLDSADTPPGPSRPRTRFNMAMGAGLGFIIGLALALLFEAMDTNLKTMSEIEQGLQLPVLAAIPDVGSEQLLPAEFKDHAMKGGSSVWSRIGEAVRGMRTSILLSSPGAPPKVIMIASTRAAEGKSSVASLLAITFGLNGSKVLLIDADLRRPALHLRFRIGKGLGLSSVLAGKATLHEAIVEWADLPNVHLLPSGPVPPLPSELLSSKQMEDVLGQARADYDFVVIDTPPVLVVTDASILARLADATILIIRYGAAQKEVVRRSIDLLERTGAHLLGIAVNAVNFSAPEYADYYDGKYYDYYGERDPE